MGKGTSAATPSSITNTQTASASFNTSLESALAGSPTTAPVSSVTSTFPEVQGSATSPGGDVSGAGHSSIPGGEITGIAVGTIILAVLVIAVLVYTRRRYTKIRAIVKPGFQVDLAARRGPLLPVIVSEKNSATVARLHEVVGVELDGGASESSAVAAEIRQEFLRNRILRAQRELNAMASAQPDPGAGARGEGEPGDLEEANRQIDGLQQRIRLLESQLQSQWALGLSDEPPPGYLG